MRVASREPRGAFRRLVNMTSVANTSDVSVPGCQLGVPAAIVWAIASEMSPPVIS